MAGSIVKFCARQLCVLAQYCFGSVFLKAEKSIVHDQEGCLFKPDRELHAFIGIIGDRGKEHPMGAVCKSQGCGYRVLHLNAVVKKLCYGCL